MPPCAGAQDLLAQSPALRYTETKKLCFAAEQTRREAECLKILNFGSLNIDKVYNVAQFVQPGQTILARNHEIFAGGKGLNQSLAAARAGASVVHAGAIGADGAFLAALLEAAGADVSHVQRLDQPSGHAIIEVNAQGQNRIIVYGGTNQRLTPAYIDDVMACGEPGDFVLLQNETNLIDQIIRKGHEKGRRVVFNPSPMPQDPAALPLALVDVFMVNEVEAAQLAGIAPQTAFEETCAAVQARYPQAAIVMTLGSRGVLYAEAGRQCAHPVFPVEAVDTTAAGDTFCGYFLAACCAGRDVQTALREASAAAALAVSRAGAAPSIPVYAQVQAFLAAQDCG